MADILWKQDLFYFLVLLRFFVTIEFGLKLSNKSSFYQIVLKTFSKIIKFQWEQDFFIFSFYYVFSVAIEKVIKISKNRVILIIKFLKMVQIYLQQDFFLLHFFTSIVKNIKHNINKTRFVLFSYSTEIFLLPSVNISSFENNRAFSFFIKLSKKGAFSFLYS